MKKKLGNFNFWSTRNRKLRAFADFGDNYKSKLAKAERAALIRQIKQLLAGPSVPDISSLLLSAREEIAFECGDRIYTGPEEDQPSS